MSLQRAALLTAIGAAAVGAAARRLQRVEVQGASMQPTLREGDRLLAVRAGRVRRGDVVAARDPRQPGRAMVKRVAALPGESVSCDGGVLRAGDGYVLLGDDLTASTDSRSFGPVPAGLLMGRCVYRYAPEPRRGALRR